LLLLPILLRFAEGRSEPRGRDVNSVEAVS
jgi:hypothetical protein